MGLIFNFFSTFISPTEMGTASALEKHASGVPQLGDCNANSEHPAVHV
jgi:hypothetical protein